MYRPVLVTAPAAAPISLEELKSWCGIDHDDDNGIVEALIAAAVTLLDGWTGILGSRCLVEQEWRQDFDEFSVCMRLPLFPVISISAVKYRDAEGEEQTVPGGEYSHQTDALGSFVRLLTGYRAPTVHREKPAISITYKAGYPTVDGKTTVPPAICDAMLMLIAHWYDNRSAVVVATGTAQALPLGVDRLLAPFRRIRI